MRPEVSIITPLYNSEKYVEQTIESVLAQSFVHWELIIINDKSTDRSAELVSKYTSDNRIVLLNNEVNIGVAFTRNRGIEFASGRYIAFLDSDDLWVPEKLQKQIEFMKKNRHLLTYTSYRKTKRDNDFFSSPVKVSYSVNYNGLLKNNQIGCLTAIYNAEILGKHFFIKVGHEDFVYWLNILKTGITAYSLSEPLATYRVHTNTVSSNKFKAARYTWNIYRNVEKMNIFKSVFYFSNYALASFIKFLK